MVEKGWHFWEADGVLVAAMPLNGKAEFVELKRWDEAKKQDVPIESKTHRWLVSKGKLTGWVIRVGQTHGSVANQSKEGGYGGLDDFMGDVLGKCKVDLSRFENDRLVTVTTDRGDTLAMRHTGGPGGKPEAWVGGKALEFKNWPVFESPYVREDAGSGVLRVTDGKETMTVDFRGEWPVVKSE